MLPRSHPAGHTREPLHAVDIARRPVAEDLVERCGQILDVARRGAAGGLRHEHTIAVGVVGAGLPATGRTGQPIERVVGITRGAVTYLWLGCRPWVLARHGNALLDRIENRCDIGER